jgi:hypothetical protein
MKKEKETCGMFLSANVQQFEMANYGVRKPASR